MPRTEEYKQNCDAIIRMEMESMQINKNIIQANNAGHLRLNKILVNEARQSIQQSREVILTMAKLKSAC